MAAEKWLRPWIDRLLNVSRSAVARSSTSRNSLRSTGRGVRTAFESSVLVDGFREADRDAAGGLWSIGVGARRGERACHKDGRGEEHGASMRLERSGRGAHGQCIEPLKYSKKF